jgi:hypothetical protein
MTLVAPLSDQEIDELEAFLESDATPHACMDISAPRRLSHRAGARPQCPASERSSGAAKRTQWSS